MVSLDRPTNEADSINAVTYGLLQGTGTIRESEITLTLVGRETPIFLLWHPFGGTDTSHPALAHEVLLQFVLELANLPPCPGSPAQLSL